MANIESIIDRFENRLERITESGCWIFLGGSLDKDGYPIIKHDGISRRAMRVAFELYVSKIPKGLVLRHSCDVRSCVNPNHLSIGTQKQNCADMVERGRSLKGESHSCVKLRESDVFFIRRHENTWNNAKILAAKFNVTPENISMILSGRTWKHLL